MKHNCINDLIHYFYSLLQLRVIGLPDHAMIFKLKLLLGYPVKLLIC